MNKILAIIGLWLATGIFSSCDKPDIGYLITEGAKYPIDSLVIMTLPRLEQEILILQDKKENFEQTPEGQALIKKKKELEAQVVKLEEEMTVVQNKIWDIDDKIDAGGLTDEEIALLQEEREQLRRYKIHDLEGARWEIRQEIKAIEEEMQDAASIDEEIQIIQRRINKGIPWTTSNIDGVLGTQPMTYRIIGISSTDGDVTAFSKCLSIMGGGRFIVEWKDTPLPVGRYVVSIEVSNEGYVTELPEAFTFIVI